MGLTNSSMGAGASSFVSTAQSGERLIALAGNPNVGKSTLFNRLTGMRQHTGNWPGKTVGSAYGYFTYKGERFLLADIPGTYSLMARSGEEEVARDALLFGGADTVIAVCDATCLKRGLCFAVQLMEVCPRLIICVNLMDEAKRRGIEIDLALLSSRLGVPVIGISAGNGDGVGALLDALALPCSVKTAELSLGKEADAALAPLTSAIEKLRPALPARWIAERLCENDAGMVEAIRKNSVLRECGGEIAKELEGARSALRELGLGGSGFSDLTAKVIAEYVDAVCAGAIKNRPSSGGRDRKIDRLLTHPIFGWVIMAAGLSAILWLTIEGANYPSAWLSALLRELGELLRRGLTYLRLPPAVLSALIDGIYKTTSWVVSVMLPPMAIFFPLFTLMEDVGVLPRVAFNLDGFFKRCGACGKQSLTMCMGLGCNAAGVVGCRIIDSPRERLIAILTNAFVPCNGRFPTIIVLISIYFSGRGALGSAGASLLLTSVIALGVVSTLLASKLLAGTLLKGVPSSFVMELPPYRRPRVGEIIVRSILDRTLFVLARAVRIAAPAGLVIWLLANINVDGQTLLNLAASALDPLGKIFGLDGAILLAFILGLPANEIVIPIMLMCYLSGASLMDYGSAAGLFQILNAHGWTAVTAVCFILFTLLHWPCSTTLISIRKETGSVKYALLSALLPTGFGLLACAVINAVSKLFI